MPALPWSTVTSTPTSPLPGEIEFTQAKGFAEAFLCGQPHKLATARTLVKDQIDKLRS
jgi:pyruvate dehydrogenase (quinone)